MAKKKFDVRHFDAAEKQQIESLLQQLSALIEGRTDAMTPEDRRRYGAVNEQNKLFIDKVLTLNKAQPHLAAPSIDWATFELEYETRKYIEQTLLKLSTTIYDLQNTKIALDSNNYNVALLDYAYSDILDQQGAPGITQKVEELSQFFAGRPRKPKDEAGTEEENDNTDSNLTT